MANNSGPACVICDQPVSDMEASSRLRHDGLQTLLDSAVSRCDEKVRNRLSSMNISDIKFHAHCRRHYNDKRKIDQVIKSDDTPVISRKFRSESPHFNWRGNCMLGGGQAVIYDRHPERNPVWEVGTTNATRDSFLKCCDATPKHPWADDVKARLLDCIDLVAVEARYHDSCNKQFRQRRCDSNIQGRPTDRSKADHFNSLCVWLEEESEAEIFSVDELWGQMLQMAGGDSEEVWSQKWLKTKLIEHYGDHIFFADIGGSRKEAICFRNMASYIVNERWYSERSNDEDTEKARIMKAAAKIIREEIRAAQYDKALYPTDDVIKDREKMRNFVVPSLRQLLDILIHRDLWNISLGQALTQAARPRSVMAPILFGIGVEMDHVLGSEWAVGTLFDHGFSICSDEVSLWKNCILQNEEQYSQNIPSQDRVQQINESICPQYAADNADSNIRTLLGDGTFHGTGIIRWVLKSSFPSTPKSAVIRRARVKVDDLCQGKGIRELNFVREGPPALSQVRLVPVIELLRPFIAEEAEYYTTLLWRSSWLLSGRMLDRSWVNWAGYVQSVFWKDGKDVSVDDVHILPHLDLNPNDQNTIYSVLIFIDQQVKAAGIPSTSVTFDQPLFIKAMEILLSIRSLSIVVRLGGFHTLMSAVGAVFDVMKASGVEDAIMEVYGPSTTQHITSGQAIARALRVLHLLDAALHTKLMECLFPHAEHTGRLNEDEMESLVQLLQNTLEPGNEHCIEDNIALQKLDTLLEEQKTELAESSRTARLWLQFLYHISVIKNFIFGERSKNCEAHLHACSQILNLFAASGHIHYAKSCCLYLQMMRRLPETHPWLYRMYMEKKMHAVQRTGHALNGLWTDLTIEQVLMASMKSRGGLTHGRGLTDSVRNQWVHTMHHRSAIHLAMGILTGKQRVTSPQHAELGKSRRHHDLNDLQKIIKWLDSHNPFESDSAGLRSLSSGISANENDDINCDNAEEVGYRIQGFMDNQVFSDVKLRKKDRVKTLQELRPGVKLGKKTVHIDPTTLCLRCVELAKRLDLEDKDFFQYEMCPVPAALFKDSFMYKTDKSTLANKMLAGVDQSAAGCRPVDHVIIDGGWLIHRLPWKRNVTFDVIVDQHSTYVQKLAHSAQCQVIFDGYSTSIKDHEHTRRSEGKTHCDVLLQRGTVNRYDRDNFFLNTQNKVRFIELLADRLQRDGHTVTPCPGDADITIVKAALQVYAENGSVDVVCTDTDILCMLVHHFQIGTRTSGSIVFRKEPQKDNPKTGGRYSVEEICESLHPAQTEAILFLHCWSGCDTTSGFYGHGKLELFNQVNRSAKLQEIARQMGEFNSPDDIGQLGVQLTSFQYGGGDFGADLTGL